MIEEILKTAETHIKRLLAAKKDLEKTEISTLNFENIETVKSTDFFIFRFIKLQDYLGNKVFKAFLSEIGEYDDSMSFLDTVDKLEKMGIIEDSKEWLTIRKLRNKLTHEYPEELEEVKEELKLAMAKTDVLIKTFQKIKTYLEAKGIIS